MMNAVEQLDSLQLLLQQQLGPATQSVLKARQNFDIIPSRDNLIVQEAEL